MESSIVNISFNDELLKQIDATAREGSRSRSELIREAARSYIEHKRSRGIDRSITAAQIRASVRFDSDDHCRTDKREYSRQT